MHRRHQDVPVREPSNVHAWLVGGGIGSLTAAVHLIADAKVPGPNIHILDSRHGPGGGMATTGDPTIGYRIYAGRQPYFREESVQRLLSSVPSAVNTKKTLLQTIREDTAQPRCPQSPTTRFIAPSAHGPAGLSSRGIPIALRYRLALIKIMLLSEKHLGRGRIRDFFPDAFFRSMFWSLWSTTFALQPWHSVVEFRRLLYRYLGEIHRLNDVKPSDRVNYTLYQSIIKPITEFLKKEGVHFQFKSKVTDLVTVSQGDSITVREIQFRDQQGAETRKTVFPKDIVIVTLGSMMSGFSQGSNSEAPASVSLLPTDWQEGDWSLWFQLATRSSRFGFPSNFCPHPAESNLETFTVTLRNSDFFEFLFQLTGDRPGCGKLVSILGSNWRLSLSIPHQPVFADQPDEVQVFWGYSLFPERNGNYVQKPMFSCTGEEVMTEILSHLSIPIQPTLATSITIPCVYPQVTSVMLPRAHGDRPNVIPQNTTNLACIGQYAEIPGDTAFSMEYSVRGAQMAVYELMGLTREMPKKIKKHRLSILQLLK